MCDLGLDLSLVLAFCCGQGRKKSRGCGVCWSVEGADWRGVEVWSLEERFRDEQPQPAAEGPQDAYRAHLIP